MNIGIIGGDIGGVAAAAAFHKFGVHATVYERAPRLQESGAGMMLWPNAASRAVVAGRGMVTKLLPAALFEHNLRRVYSYEP